MATCLPNDPIAYDRRIGGFTAFTALSTTATTQYWPLGTDTINFTNMAEVDEQALEMVQVTIRETAPTSGTITKNDLDVYLYSGSSPSTTRTLGSVWEADTDELLCKVEFRTANYYRINSTTWECVGTIRRPHGKTADISTADTVYVPHAVVAGTTPTAYTSTAALSLHIVSELAQSAE